MSFIVKGSSMGNFPIFAHSSCQGDQVDNCAFDVSDREIGWRQDSVEASPGYFGIALNNSISVETTVTNHSALYRFTFPDQSSLADNTTLSPLILTDLVDLSGTRSESKVSVDAKTGRLSGSGSFGPSFGSGSYSMYFCMDFDGADLRRAGGHTKDGSVIIGPNSDPEVPNPLAAFVQFHAPENEDNQILVRVGISFISTEQACGNAEREQPDFDFAGTVAAAESAWEEKLSVVEISTEGVDKDMEVIFWSGIYRTMISPQDYTGENPLWESDEPYYDSYYWWVISDIALQGHSSLT
jgi:putative alpha-1,2-mannosidase